MRTQSFLLICATLAACSPVDTKTGAQSTAKPRSNEVTPSPGPQINEASLFGSWRILSLNGVAVKSPSSGSEMFGTARVNFWQSGFGVATGCNGYGGNGLLRGNRYYTAPGPSTAIGCPNLDAQEATITNAMRAAPRVSFDADGKLRIESKDVIMILLKDPGASAALPKMADIPPQFLLAGTSWQIAVVDGQYLTPRSQQEARPLVFEADNWSAKPACATISGNWVQRGDVVETKGEANATEQACPAKEAAIDTSVAQILKTNPTFVNGANGELLLAGDGHWLIGVREPVLVDEASLLKGNWRIASIDGANPATSSKPTLSFGAAFYAGSTGCNTINGTFLAHTRRLFTFAGPQTEMGCGPLTPQEERITGLLASSPSIARLSSGRLALVDAKGRLELERDQTNQIPLEELASQTLDRSQRKIEALRLDGEDVPKSASNEEAIMTFTDARWTTNAGCGGLMGDWVKRESRIDLYSSGRPAELPPCSAARQIWTDKMNMMMNGPSRVVINENGEFLLANHDHWITGRSTPRRGAR
jgi:heat shock protein HslJ